MGGSIAGEAAELVLASRYRVEGKLGIGGMGIVYRAIDLETGDTVAIKVLDHKKAQPAQLEQRFAREVSAVKRLRSPHSVRLLDAGRLPDGNHFMVMEYLDGCDLHALVMQRGSLPVDRAARLIVQACAGIGEAHALGIVHRDIKPANLFVTTSSDGGDCLKVLDFGISKLPQSTMDEMALTNTGTVLGSPVYMSPEQMTSSRTVDGRADVWALGVVLYQLLSGGFPYEADGLPELCAKVLTQEPLALSALVRVPPGLEAAVMRCLAKDPARRFARVEDLAIALSPFAGDSPSPPTVVGLPPRPPLLLPLPAPTPTPTPPPTRPAIFVEPDSGDRSRRIRMTGAAIGLVAGIVYLVVTWPRAQEAPPPIARPPITEAAAPAAVPEPPRAAPEESPAPAAAHAAKKSRRPRRGQPPERGSFDSPLPP